MGGEDAAVCIGGSGGGVGVAGGDAYVVADYSGGADGAGAVGAGAVSSEGDSVGVEGGGWRGPPRYFRKGEWGEEDRGISGVGWADIR